MDGKWTENRDKERWFQLGCIVYELFPTPRITPFFVVPFLSSSFQSPSEPCMRYRNTGLDAHTRTAKSISNELDRRRHERNRDWNLKVPVFGYPMTLIVIRHLLS